MNFLTPVGRLDRSPESIFSLALICVVGCITIAAAMAAVALALGLDFTTPRSVGAIVAICLAFCGRAIFRRRLFAHNGNCRG